MKHLVNGRLLSAGIIYGYANNEQRNTYFHVQNIFPCMHNFDVDVILIYLTIWCMRASVYNMYL